VPAEPLAREKSFLEQPPLRGIGDFYQGSIDRLFDRAMLRQRDRHIGGRNQTLRYFKRFGVAHRHVILQRADAVDDRVRLAVHERIQRLRQILEFRELQVQLVEMLRAGGLSDGCKLPFTKIDRRREIARFHAFRGQPRNQTGRQQGNQHQAAEHPRRSHGPPLRKALAPATRLLAALAGTFPNEGPLQSFRLADLHLPTELPVSLFSQLIEQRPDIRAAQEQLHAASAKIGVAIAKSSSEFHHQRQHRLYEYDAGRSASARKLVLDGCGERDANRAGRRQALPSDAQESKDLYNAAAWSYRGTVISAVQNVSDGR
jgi:hypothetical protein